MVPDDVVEERLHALILEGSAHADRHEGLRESGPDVTAYLEEQPRCRCCKQLQVKGIRNNMLLRRQFKAVQKSHQL